MLVAQLISTLGQVGSQQFEVGRPAAVVTHRVDPEGERRQPETPKERVGQGDHLDVKIGIGGPERLDAQLVVLTIPPRLGSLVAEGGGGIPRLPRQRRAMLDKRSNHGSRTFGPERQHSATAVFELIHLLADHIAALADSAAKDLHVLEDRRVSQPVSGSFDVNCEEGQERLPTGRLGPQDIVGSTGGACNERLVGHGQLSPFCRGGSDTRRRRHRGGGSGSAPTPGGQGRPVRRRTASG